MTPFFGKYPILGFLAACSILIAACEVPSGNVQETTVAESPIPQPVEGVFPYIVSVEEIDSPFVFPRLQSFALGRQGDQWLLVGGRTTGLHGIGRQPFFPSSGANDSLYVIDIRARKSWSAPLPATYRFSLSTSNMEFVQSGDTLYLVGGYGHTQDLDPESRFTFPYLTAIEVPGMIRAIVEGKDPSPFFLYQIADTAMLQVTGGSLHRIDKRFFLVGGQNFSGVYSASSTGKYTEAVRSFQIDLIAGQEPRLKAPQIWTDTQSPSRLHRRDLNVVEAIRSGNPGLTIYGGVFTLEGGPFVSPVYIDLNQEGEALLDFDTVFQQRTSQYDCARILLHDAPQGVMYTTLIGGISLYQYDAEAARWQLGNGIDSLAMPFIPLITTLARTSVGRTFEYPQLPPKHPVLPALIGTDAIFIADLDLLIPGTSILDVSRLHSGEKQPIGYLYGGIKATAPMSNKQNPTYTNDKIYRVFLQIPPSES